MVKEQGKGAGIPGGARQKLTVTVCLQCSVFTIRLAHVSGPHMRFKRTYLIRIAATSGRGVGQRLPMSQSNFTISS